MDKLPQSTAAYLFTLPSLLIVILLGIVGCHDSSNSSRPPAAIGVELVTGVPLVGGANGMFFDANDKLWVASVFAGTISRIDPETGEILEQLGLEEDAGFADDLTIGPDGTLYWTNVSPGRVMARPPGEPTVELATGIPSANPITIGDDGRLYAAQCFASGSNGIFEIDPTGVNESRTIRSGDTDCASNGMDWWNGVLYSPRWFEGRVVQVDVDSGELMDITTGWPAPAAVKFNSLGELYGQSQATGEVVKIDLATGERELVAQFPTGWLDNLAFDSRDRLFVSSVSDGNVTEILANGDLRDVSPGGMVLPIGIALLGNTVYTAQPQALRGYNAKNGEETSVIRSVAGVGPLDLSTGIAPVQDKLAVMSWIDNSLKIWDPSNESVEVDIAISTPVDAVQMGDYLLVSQFFNGTVVRAKLPDLAEQEVIVNRVGFTIGLAVEGDNAYVSDSLGGTVFQIIRDGEVLSPPEAILEELAIPEGIAVTGDGTRLLVIESETSSLSEINLDTGERITIATDLQLLPTQFPGLNAGWFNDVDVDADGNMFVNSDGGNIIYKFPPGTVVE